MLSFNELTPLAAAIVALVVFVYNTIQQRRARKLENLARFTAVHQRLFDEKGYIAKNIVAFNSGTLVRDKTNEVMESLFQQMLLEVEKLAILGENDAVPDGVQTYMFAWYAQRINPLLSDYERTNKFWDLAVTYLDKMVAKAVKYESLSSQERAKYWKLG